MSNIICCRDLSIVRTTSHPVARNRLQESRCHNHKLSSFQLALNFGQLCSTHSSDSRKHKLMLLHETSDCAWITSHKHIWTVTQYIHRNQCSLFLSLVLNLSNKCTRKAKNCLIINKWPVLVTAPFNYVILRMYRLPAYSIPSLAPVYKHCSNCVLLYTGEQLPCPN